MAYLAQIGGFQQIITNMQQMGFFQFLFPFLLTLAILFGLLEWAFGGEKEKRKIPKSANALISLIISFFVMLWTVSNPGVVAFFANISGYWLVAGSGILFILILLALVGVKTEQHFLSSLWGKWALILTIIAIGVVIFFGAGGQSLIGVPYWMFSSELWTIVFFIIILAVVLFVVSSEKTEKTGG
jgi:hypothetical protein